MNSVCENARKMRRRDRDCILQCHECLKEYYSLHRFEKHSMRCLARSWSEDNE